MQRNKILKAKAGLGILFFMQARLVEELCITGPHNLDGRGMGR